MKKLGPVDKIKKALDLATENGNSNEGEAYRLVNGITKDDLKKLSRKELGEYFFVFGELYYFTDHPDRAIDMFKKAIKFIDKNKKPECFYYLGGAYYDKDKFKDAVKYLKKALNLIQLKKNINLEIKILDTLSLSYLDLEEYKESLSASKRIINLCKNNPGFNKDELCYGAISNFAICYWKLGNEKKADEYADKVISMKNVPKWVMRSTYCNLGHRALSKNRHKEAQQYYKKALSYSEEKENKGYFKDLIAECDKGLNYMAINFPHNAQ